MFRLARAQVLLRSVMAGTANIRIFCRLVLCFIFTFTSSHITYRIDPNPQRSVTSNLWIWPFQTVQTQRYDLRPIKPQKQPKSSPRNSGRTYILIIVGQDEAIKIIHIKRVEALFLPNKTFECSPGLNPEYAAKLKKACALNTARIAPV